MERALWMEGENEKERNEEKKMRKIEEGEKEKEDVEEVLQN